MSRLIGAKTSTKRAYREKRPVKTETRDGMAAFRANLRDGAAFEALFDYLPDVCFFVKDRQSRLMLGNPALLRLLAQTSMDAIFGRTGSDFYPPGIADSFHQDDRDVMEGRRPLLERIELLLDEVGTVSWFCTTKLPLYGKDGDVVGLAGVTRNLRKADPRLHPFAKMMPAVDAIRHGYRDEIDLDALARSCNLSLSQFRRQFKELFRESPLQFILKIRIQAAANLLRTSSLNVTQIAQECGFGDSNYFTRQFRRLTGVTPSVYRRHKLSDLA